MTARRRLASLGMYDMAWLTASNQAIWAWLRDRLRALGVRDAPDALETDMPLWDVWRSPDLLLAQTCGYPLLTLGDAVQVVATPTYDLRGCEGPLYRSLLVVAERVSAEAIGELRGLRAAVNDWDSNSGMNAFRAAIAPHAGGPRDGTPSDTALPASDGRFFAEIVTTGGHMMSLAALRDGVADVAAIDCVSHGLTARHRPGLLRGTRVIGETAAIPGLPLITAAGTGQDTVAALRSALRALVASSDMAWHRAALGLTGFAVVPRETYATIGAMEDAAVALGYPRLA